MSQDQSKAAAQYVQQQCPNFEPEIALILGSGLGALADEVQNATVIPYADIPGFPVSQVSGHAGNMVLGELQGRRVVCMQGRVHLYEGYEAGALQTFIRTLKHLGCHTMVATNAAGSLNEAMTPGSLVAISDHVNLQGFNALVGRNDDSVGPRFPSMDNAYDAGLRQTLLAEAKAQNIAINTGVYFGLMGPSFETHAEIRMFKLLGADVVGMSTVNDVIVARHCGMKVLAVSVVTNMAAGMQQEALSHEETLSNAKIGTVDLIKLIKAVLPKL